MRRLSFTLMPRVTGDLPRPALRITDGAGAKESVFTVPAVRVVCGAGGVDAYVH